MKRAALGLLIVLGFLAGYGAAAKAWPGVPDRNQWYGYFNNQLDNQGDTVIPNGIPSNVTNANAFISFMENELKNGSPRGQIGAAFIIQTMRGTSGGWSRNHPPTASELADWESRVRYAESQGWIQWSANFTYSGNSYWQGNRGGGPDPNDDAFYYQSGVRISIIFHDQNGVAYVIKRDCGNPLTNGYMPGLFMGWSGAGNTTVSAAQATPGQTVTFSHYVWDQGPTTALMYWGTFDSQTGAQLAQGGPSSYTPGNHVNVANDNFTIPANAAAGTQYCRQVGWFWDSSSNSAWGKGTPVCTTVIIPAKLKAAISASPPTVSGGDVLTFNPSISASNNASPVTGVTCSQTQTTYAPSGGATGSSSIPCTDQSGSSSITIGTGASVALKQNTYTVPDTMPVGSKICQTITITNPNNPAYYNNYPADTTSTTCAIVAKSPYVQFLGGDVWAGGGFASVAPACNTGAKLTGVTRAHALADGTTPGSGVAYAAFALDKISNFGSASMALVTTTGTGDAWTFSNINPNSLGFFGAPQHCITDYSALYTSAATLAGGSTVDVAAQGSGVWHTTGNLTIHGVMPDGSRQVYLVDGDVDIDANLTYKPTFAGVSAIPSLIIVSKHNVHVFSAVTQVDGIVEVIGDGVTTGLFRTCWPEPAQATTSTCPTTLTVNGAVLAGGLDLFRTAGAEGNTPTLQKQPAEVFNLGSEVYINDALNSTSTTTLTTSNVRELPPRF